MMSLLSDYLEKHPMVDVTPNDLLVQSVTTETIKEMSKAIATECMIHGVNEVTISVFADIDGWEHLVNEKRVHLTGKEVTDESDR
jgi:hypothetical protein